MRRYIDNAIRTGKTVTIKYIKFEGEYSVRQISDIQYSSEFGDDYIDAFCHKRQERRTFRLSRIISVDGVTQHQQITPQSKKAKTAYTGSTSSSLSHKPEQTITTRPNNSYSQPTRVSTPSSTKKSEGCYIATMAYGDYNHPKVIVLRRFRDDILAKSVYGRVFIKIYYWISPKLVKMLSNHKYINAAIRWGLDRIVKQL
jgi:hypothetical protein